MVLRLIGGVDSNWLEVGSKFIKVDSKIREVDSKQGKVDSKEEVLLKEVSGRAYEGGLFL